MATSTDERLRVYGNRTNSQRIEHEQAHERLHRRCIQLEEAVEEALMHLDTNYDCDGNCMKDSDAADCLRRVLPNDKVSLRGSQKGLE